MTDLIHKAELFNRLSTAQTLADAFAAIQDMPTAEQWIPCDKGEPDEDMECWVTVKATDALYRGNFTKRYGVQREKGFITGGAFVLWHTAIAWMPVYEPEPYRPEGEEHGTPQGV